MPTQPSAGVDPASHQGDRLRNSQHQFMHLADRLLGAMKNEEDEVQYAIGAAKGFNLVSKSMKTLPAAGKGISIPKQPVKFGKLVGPDAGDAPVEVQQRTEQKRDEQIATRLQQINDKQSARIREIKEHEKKERETKQRKLESLAAGGTNKKDIDNRNGSNSSIFAVNPNS